MGTFTNSEDPDEMPRYRSKLFVKVKRSSDKNTLKKYYNPTSLDMYNGLS